MTASTDTGLIQSAEAHYSEDRKVIILLKIGKRYSIEEDAENIILQDSRYPNRPAYFSTLAGALGEVFERQVKARVSEDSRKSLEALKDAIMDTRAELRMILSIEKGVKENEEQDRPQRSG